MHTSFQCSFLISRVGIGLSSYTPLVLIRNHDHGEGWRSSEAMRAYIVNLWWAEYWQGCVACGKYWHASNANRGWKPKNLLVAFNTYMRPFCAHQVFLFLPPKPLSSMTFVLVIALDGVRFHWSRNTKTPRSSFLLHPRSFRAEFLSVPECIRFKTSLR